MNTRDEALVILDEWIDNENLLQHLIQVEACMKHFAGKYYDEGKIETDKSKEELVNLWSLAGLLHDADWEKFPDVHPAEIIKRLKEEGWDEGVIQAISSHGNNGELYGDRFTERNSLIDKTLFAIDELSGFIHAYSLMRPEKYDGMKAKSVKKKLKDKGFAKGVNRDDIRQGVEELEVDLGEHVGELIEIMKNL